MDAHDYIFDKIFILKSLGESDTFADSLYYDIIEPCCQKCGLATEPPIELYTREDWDKAIEQILQDNCYHPLIHFEMHGNEENGLYLRLGDYVPWKNVISDLTRINVKSELNLIITMAVCYSTKLAFNMSMVKSPAPYLFSISTSQKVRGELTYKMFSEFYKNLIESRSIYDALKSVEQTHPDLPQFFDILSIPFLFENTFKEYALQHQDDGMLEKEFYHSFPEMQEREVTRDEYNWYKKAFVKNFRSNVNACYREYRDIFFMFDKFPNNSKRFKLPDDII